MKYGIDYLTLTYGGETESVDLNEGYRGIYNKKAKIINFGIRRQINR